MGFIGFNDLADFLRHGREIEFSYKGRAYSITNHSGFWYLCDDTDRVLLETVCRFDEKELLVLVKQVMERDDLKHCPHGRPICISLSKKQLEKQFKR